MISTDSKNGAACAAKRETHVMDFEFSEEQEAFRAVIRAFAGWHRQPRVGTLTT